MDSLKVGCKKEKANFLDITLRMITHCDQKASLYLLLKSNKKILRFAFSPYSIPATGMEIVNNSIPVFSGQTMPHSQHDCTNTHDTQTRIWGRRDGGYGGPHSIINDLPSSKLGCIRPDSTCGGGGDRMSHHGIVCGIVGETER